MIINFGSFRGLRVGVFLGFLLILVSLAAIFSVSAADMPGSANRVTPFGGTVTPTVCSAGWNTSPSLDPSLVDNLLVDVAALSASDVWAVGLYKDNGGQNHPLVEHWNGSQWSISPTDVLTSVVLHAVTAIAPDDLWAAGNRNTVLHWNGQTWSQVPGPMANSYLYDIDGRAGNDLWVVGYYEPPRRPLIAHWDGSQWTQVSTTLNGSLNSVKVISANDVWAIGTKITATYEKLLLHWDGSQWTEVTAPAFPNGELLSIDGVSANDLWVNGYWSPPTNGTYALHWDGTQWSVVQAQGSDTAFLMGVSAIASDDVWFVGGSVGGSVTMHWDGGSLQRVSNPHGPRHDQLNGVDGLPSGRVWAVGQQDAEGFDRYLTLVQVYESCAELTPTPTASAVPSATPTPTVCEPGWYASSTLNPGGVTNFFNDVTALSDTDVWAIGGYQTTYTTTATRPLMQHWNGVTWSSMPDVGPPGTFLNAVVSFGPNDIWAVGGTNTVLHWDGTAWTQMPGPDNNLRDLNGIDGTGSNDLWVVGGPLVQPYTILIFHWDGAQWVRFNLLFTGVLYDVKAIAANDVWTVGRNAAASSKLILHWDGFSWNEVVSPGNAAILYGVDALSATDVWVVGWSGGSNPAYTAHWDGSQWTLFPVPASPQLVALQEVSAIASNNVWAVGSQNGQRQDMILHWDGVAWQWVPNPHPEYSSALFNGVDGLPNGRVWAVGQKWTTDPFHALTLTQYYEPCQNPTPTSTRTATPSATSTSSAVPLATRTATASQTPGAPSATSTSVPTGIATNTATHTSTSLPTQTPGGATATTIPTNTPVSSPTTCPMQFADVPEGHTFYPYVRCLACRGIISGYACGGAGEPCNGNGDPYFRPNNGVTRGQIGKIVSEAIGFEEDVSGQTFEDVAPGSTFHIYVERLAARGVMQGYPCGGAGEPCGPGNRPYFRPNAGATRGQLAKSVSNAMEWSDTVAPGQYTFADAPEGSTFHVYIERLLMHRPGAMQGYPCGGGVPPGSEPCDSQSRPYFRPGNTLTRGQTAKIISNAVFPACAP